MTTELEGPWLVAALLCEKVLEEKDSALSAIRIVDRIILNASGPGAPEKMPPLPVQLTALISFKSGFAKGNFTVKVRPVSPSQQKIQGMDFPIFLEGDERGANVIVNLGMTLNEDGLYWFDVLLGDRLLTRMPLRIIYQRMTTNIPPEAR